MQNSQEINLLIVIWEIAKIVIPIFTTLGIGFWLSRKTENYKRDLSKEIEDYKKDISKEIENHKIQLQSDFQTKFYQYQTKFSFLHQRQAAAIEELYSLIAKAENSLSLTRFRLKDISKKDVILNKVYGNEPEKEFLDDWRNLTNYFDQKRIFFERDIEEDLDKIINSIENAYKFSSFSKYVEHGFVNSDFTSDELWKSATEFFEDNFSTTKEKLRENFRNLLSAETPNYELEKK